MPRSQGFPKHLRTCVVVADARQAKLYVKEEKSPQLHWVVTLRAPSKDSYDIERRHAGRTFESLGGGARHKIEAHSNIAAEMHHLFARQIADYLYASQQKKIFNQLVLVMPPKMLGAVKPLLAKPVQRTVSNEWAKDLVKCSDEELSARLKEIA